MIDRYVVDNGLDSQLMPRHFPLDDVSIERNLDEDIVNEEENRAEEKEARNLKILQALEEALEN